MEVSMSHPHDMVQRYCAVCGRPATDKHHEPPKGLGGIGKKGTEPPVISLCDNFTGCHAMRHRHELEFKHDEAFGWMWRGKSATGIVARIWTPCRDDAFWEHISRFYS